MITFKLGARKTGITQTGVAPQAESSQWAIHKLSPLGLLARAIKPPPGQAVDASPASTGPERIERFYSVRQGAQRWRLFISSFPLSVALGLGFYLFFRGATQWVVGVVMLTGFAISAFAGLLFEYQRLKPFVCPRCQAPIQDWDTNETHRILFNCVHCGSNWDIDYKRHPQAEPTPSLAV
jgi:hypothetical protein